MLLTISTTRLPATDLGYLLHKRPDRFQSFGLSFGQAHVFYPVASQDVCTAALLLDVDPIGMAKSHRKSLLLGDYVNDRPFVASSFMSVAISQVFGTALAGRCAARTELVRQPLPLTARIDVVPARGAAGFVERLFQPLGYQVTAVRHPLDSRFLEWGESPYYSVSIAGTVALAELLTHLYVLMPVFDNEKHYFVGADEMEKLLLKGAGWLAAHPEKEQITRRYLKHQSSLYREALARLTQDEPVAEEEGDNPRGEQEAVLERPLSLNDQRHAAVLAALRQSNARSVLDLGCADGKLLRSLIAERQFDKIVGLDVSARSLEIASKRLALDRLSERQAERVKLIHGSLIYRDSRLAGFDAAALVEVIEHLDPPRLSALERVLYEFARPKTVVITTPNREYNVKWETLPAGRFRHADHRFEWTRQEFQEWAERVAGRYGYAVRFLPVGPVDDVVGPPTQMGVFARS